MATGTGARARLAGWPGANSDPAAKTNRWLDARSANCFHNPQSRVSGEFPARGVRFYQPAAGLLQPEWDRVLRFHELPQGGDSLLGPDHHGKPAVCARNHDRGIRLWPGRNFTAAPKRARWNP